MLVMRHRGICKKTGRQKNKRSRINETAREEDGEKLVRKILEKERRKIEAAQKLLLEMGRCTAGFEWTKQAGGHRCAGGSHWMSSEELDKACQSHKIA